MRTNLWRCRVCNKKIKSTSKPSSCPNQDCEGRDLSRKRMGRNSTGTYFLNRTYTRKGNKWNFQRVASKAWCYK